MAVGRATEGAKEAVGTTAVEIAVAETPAAGTVEEVTEAVAREESEEAVTEAVTEAGMEAEARAAAARKVWRWRQWRRRREWRR